MNSIPFADADVPRLTTEQMIEVDRAMMEDYRIDLPRMMENAGRTLAQLARARFLQGEPRGKRIAVLAGSGGNGGGALVAARRLHNWGAEVRVVLAQPAGQLTPVPAHQWSILEFMGVQAATVQQLTSVDLLLDGLIGYSLKGAPSGLYAELIRWANQQAAPTLALDVPSGIDAGSGTVYDPVIQAAATLTLALPKHGLDAEQARPFVGELYLGDISVPPGLYARPPLNITVGPLFAASDIIRLR